MIEAGVANENEGNHFTIDWDGPDDPNNPRKSDPPAEYGVRLKSFSAAGHSARNGS